MDMPALDFVSDFLTTLAALGGSGGVLVYLLKRVQKREELELPERTLVSLENVAETYEILQELLNGVGGACRVLLLRSEDSGGIPGPNTSVFSSVLHEVHAAHLEPVRESWTSVPVDPEYARLLRSLAREGKVNLLTTDMHDGPLKTLYKCHGISRAYVRAIHADEAGFTYLTINVACPEFESSEDQELMRSCVIRLRNLLRGHDRPVRDWPA